MLDFTYLLSYNTIKHIVTSETNQSTLVRNFLIFYNIYFLFSLPFLDFLLLAMTPPKPPLIRGDFVVSFLFKAHIHLKINNKKNGAIEFMMGLSKINQV